MKDFALCFNVYISCNGLALCTTTRRPRGAVVTSQTTTAEAVGSILDKIRSFIVASLAETVRI